MAKAKKQNPKRFLNLSDEQTEQIKQIVDDFAAGKLTKDEFSVAAKEIDPKLGKLVSDMDSALDEGNSFFRSLDETLTKGDMQFVPEYGVHVWMKRLPLPNGRSMIGFFYPWEAHDKIYNTELFHLLHKRMKL